MSSSRLPEYLFKNNFVLSWRCFAWIGVLNGEVIDEQVLRIPESQETRNGCRNY
jgi:hypothetical protein